MHTRRERHDEDRDRRRGRLRTRRRHLLAREHEIVVYEAERVRRRAHATRSRVESAERDTTHVDTGFIVMNDRNYPNFTRLLDQLGVAHAADEHELLGQGRGRGLRVRGHAARALLPAAQPRCSPRFQRMIARPAALQPRAARDLLAGTERQRGPRRSLGEFLARRRFSRAFVERLIVPQVSAVWSADPRQMCSFPVRFLAEFFANHGMLGFRDRPRWSTVAGGSARYVEALTRRFASASGCARPCARSRATSDHVEITVGDARGGRETERFDQVVIATHSDQALALLSDPSARERDAARRDPLPAQRGGPAHRQHAAAAPSRRARGLELPPAARAQAAEHRHLLHEPPAAPARRARLLRHAQPHRGDRPRARSSARSPTPTPSSRPRASPRRPSTRASAASPAAPTTAAPTGAGAFTRTACVSALRACEPFGVTL